MQDWHDDASVGSGFRADLDFLITLEVHQPFCFSECHDQGFLYARAVLKSILVHRTALDIASAQTATFGGHPHMTVACFWGFRDHGRGLGGDRGGRGLDWGGRFDRGVV